MVRKSLKEGWGARLCSFFSSWTSHCGARCTFFSSTQRPDLLDELMAFSACEKPSADPAQVIKEGFYSVLLFPTEQTFAKHFVLLIQSQMHIYIKYIVSHSQQTVWDNFTPPPPQYVSYFYSFVFFLNKYVFQDNFYRPPKSTVMGKHFRSNY